MKKIYPIITMLCLCVYATAQEFDKTIETIDGKPCYVISAQIGTIYTGLLNIPDSLETPPSGTGTTMLPVKKIADNAFSYSQITELRIPQTVEIIGKSAFENCNQLRRVYIYAECDKLSLDNTESPSSSFAFNNGFTALYVPADEKDNYVNFGYETYFPGGIFTIEEGAVSITATAETKGNNTVDFVWFRKDGIQKYVLTVKDDEGYSVLTDMTGSPVSELMFDANGNQLSSDGLAPVRQLETNSTMTVVVISIGPLGSKKNYNYEIKGTDSNGVETYRQTGNFSLDTEGESVKLEQHHEPETQNGLEETGIEAGEIRKVMIDGTVYIEKDGRRVNMLGQETAR